MAARTLMAVALLGALTSPTMAARRHPACVPVMIEMIPVNICARPQRR